jgi:hypothetical protein
MVRGIIIVLLFTLTACEVHVKNVYDKTVDFSEYKTFCWMNGCEFDFDGPGYFKDSLVRKNLKAAIISELKEKGLTIDTDNPDLLIGFTVALTDEQAIIFNRPEESQFNIQPLEHEREIINYLKGSIIIGMADKKQSRMVWESQAIGYLERRPEFTPEDIQKGIKKVFKNYPPKKRN